LAKLEENTSSSFAKGKHSVLIVCLGQARSSILQAILEARQTWRALFLLLQTASSHWA
jgi:hypothetical protein